jgi:hypothetical protein
MPPQQTFRPTDPVPAAARSTNLIEPAQSAFRAIRATGVSPARSSRLQLSDHQLREHVLVQVLKFGPQIAQAVNFDVRHGEVTLSGVVGSDYERSLIEQAVGRLAGVQRLQNDIDVRRAPPVRVAAANRLFGLGKSPWKTAAIAGVLVVAVASLLLFFQVTSAAAGDGRPGLTTLAGDGSDQSSSFCATGECCMSLEMRR